VSDVPFDQLPPEERRRIVDEAIELVKSGKKTPAMVEWDGWLKRMQDEFEQRRVQWEEEMRTSDDPEVRLQWAIHQRQKACRHENVPPVKSFYSDEMVQRGVCPDCGVHLLELD
jgi:hypothetical protein